MIAPFAVKCPGTLREACRLLWEKKEQAKIIAGGTDLVPALRQESLVPRYLIDITHINELRNIVQEDGQISIGAVTTHTEIASSSLIKKYGSILADAASVVGSPQIRNLGTLGGNIVNASPAADTIPPLLVLDAVGKVVSREGEREVPLAQLFRGPYDTALKPYEILTRVSFRQLAPEAKSSFIKLARRQAMAISRMSIAVVLRMERRTGRIAEARVSLGAVTPTPQRMPEAEAILKGKRPDDDGLQMASVQVSEAMIRQSGIRASTVYKRPVIEALFIRAVRKALEEG